MRPIKISKRLETVASFLPPGTFFADIGSDHAYLPCYVCLHDNQARAIAGEVNEGPYYSACKTVSDHLLADRVEIRLGDGLQVLKKDEITELVIAGMGGSLIKSILKDGSEKLHRVKRIIAQPNMEARNVRKWFLLNEYIITDEMIIEENEHIYEIIVADRKESQTTSKSALSEKELLFGPLLMTKKNPVFFKKWEMEKVKLETIIKQMKQASIQNEEKIARFKLELTWIKEVLQGDESDEKY
ncbi:MAG TPA: tRNA (adenine(22)-N(1))-methyltransferase TrmK [Virgibacillus sp.]|nr:tRNA (adenine(22)-N(1))-methyltransferase TrmK [Virgibacillus sp.]